MGGRAANARRTEVFCAAPVSTEEREILKAAARVSGTAFETWARAALLNVADPLLVNPGKRWTPQRDRRLVDLLERGFPDTAIADVLQAHADTITRRRHLLGLPSRPGPPRFPPLPAQPEGGAWWTPDREQRLRELVATGHFDAQIAGTLGTSSSRVHLRRTALGLQRPPSPKKPRRRHRKPGPKPKPKPHTRSQVCIRVDAEELGLIRAAGDSKWARRILLEEARETLAAQEELVQFRRTMGLPAANPAALKRRLLAL